MALPYIQFNEPMAGAGGGFTDTLNRALRALLSQSGYNPDATIFPGLAGPVYNVRAFGAVGDGVTDDYAAFAAAIAAAAAAVGGKVHVPVGTYAISLGLVIPPFVQMSGSGYKSQLVYTATSGACLTLGNSDTVLSYKTGVENLVIVLAQKTTTAIRLRGTNGAVLRNLYLEGDTSHGYTGRTNIGVDIDGVNISTFFNLVDTVQCNHMHTGFLTRTTGTTYATCSTFINCASGGDVTLGDTGSLGFYFLGHTSARIAPETGYNGPGEGSIIIGGDVEYCGTGVKVEGGPVTVTGLRFEGNGTDLVLTSFASRNTIRDCPTLVSVSDSSLTYSNNLIELATEREGRYTATMSTGTGTITLTSGAGGDLCFYSKRGKLVTVWGSVTIASISAVGGTNVYITLPFVSRAGAGNFVAASIRAAGWKAGTTTVVQGYVDAGLDHLVIEKYAAGNPTSLVSDVQAGASIIFSVTYMAA